MPSKQLSQMTMIMTFNNSEQETCLVSLSVLLCEVVLYLVNFPAFVTTLRVNIRK